MRGKKTKRPVDGLKTLDEFLKDEGKLQEFEVMVVEEVRAWQIANTRKSQGR